MVEENINQEFKLKNIDETRNYFLEEIKQNELMSKKHKKVCLTLNYTEHFLIFCSTITGCISISAIFFFDCYSYRNHKLCKRITNLCNNCRNLCNKCRTYQSIIKKK